MSNAKPEDDCTSEDIQLVDVVPSGVVSSVSISRLPECHELVIHARGSLIHKADGRLELWEVAAFLCQFINDQPTMHTKQATKHTKRPNETTTRKQPTYCEEKQTVELIIT